MYSNRDVHLPKIHELQMDFFLLNTATKLSSVACACLDFGLRHLLGKSYITLGVALKFLLFLFPNPEGGDREGQMEKRSPCIC